MTRSLTTPLLVLGLICSSIGGTACGGDATSDPSDPSNPAGTGTAGGESEGGADGTAQMAGAEVARAEGRNFSIPIPAGYERTVSGTVADMMREEVLTPGGVILMADASGAPGATPGTIVVSPTASDISSDAIDESLCGTLAQLVANQHGATVDRVGMAELPWGRACQWVLLTGNDENRRRLGTVFAAHAEDWIVTCNYDERDEAASAACGEVLNGWVFSD